MTHPEKVIESRRPSVAGTCVDFENQPVKNAEIVSVPPQQVRTDRQAIIKEAPRRKSVSIGSIQGSSGLTSSSSEPSEQSRKFTMETITRKSRRSRRLSWPNSPHSSIESLPPSGLCHTRYQRVRKTVRCISLEPARSTSRDKYDAICDRLGGDGGPRRQEVWMGK